MAVLTLPKAIVSDQERQAASNLAIDLNFMLNGNEVYQLSEHSQDVLLEIQALLSKIA